MAQDPAAEVVDGGDSAPPTKRKIDIGSILTLIVVLGFFAENAAMMAIYKPWQHGLPDPAGAVDLLPTADAAELPGDHVCGATGPALPKAVHSLDPFVVNLADRKPRYGKAKLMLGFDSQDAIDEMVANPAAVAAIRQAVSDLIGNRLAEQISTTAGKTQLREDIKSRLNEMALPDVVREVYITELLVQY